MLMAITVQAQPLRDGHFFKTFSDGQPTAEAAPTLFEQWFALPEGTEWREVSRQTDNIGMERIEYRQYVSGIEVEYSQVLLHVRDGRVQSAKDLYGDNSAEVEAVAKAWDLVGVTDDTPTGIVEAEANSQLSTLNSPLSDWYTIDGRQLSSKPTTKGLYIYHGCVFVVK